MDIPAISIFPNTSGIARRIFPIRIPITMHRITHTVRYFWKELMPVSFFQFCHLSFSIIVFYLIETLKYFYILG